MPTYSPIFSTPALPGGYGVNEITPVFKNQNSSYVIAIPNYGPFFAGSLTVTSVDGNGNPVTLVLNTDYTLALPFIGASRASAKPVFGAIIIKNATYQNSQIKTSYVSVGGNWVLGAIGNASMVVSIGIRNPSALTWEMVSATTTFPATPSAWDKTDTTKMSAVINALSGLNTSIKNRSLVTSYSSEISHQSNFSNPHYVDYRKLNRRLPVQNKIVDGSGNVIVNQTIFNGKIYANDGTTVVYDPSSNSNQVIKGNDGNTTVFDPIAPKAYLLTGNDGVTSLMSTARMDFTPTYGSVYLPVSGYTNRLGAPISKYVISGTVLDGNGKVLLGDPSDSSYPYIVDSSNFYDVTGKSVVFSYYGPGVNVTDIYGKILFNSQLSVQNVFNNNGQVIFSNQAVAQRLSNVANLRAATKADVLNNNCDTAYISIAQLLPLAKNQIPNATTAVNGILPLNNGGYSGDDTHTGKGLTANGFITLAALNNNPAIASQSISSGSGVSSVTLVGPNNFSSVFNKNQVPALTSAAPWTFPLVWKGVTFNDAQSFAQAVAITAQVNHLEYNSTLGKFWFPPNAGIPDLTLG